MPKISLKNKAKTNTTVTKRKDKKDTTIKEGVPLDSSARRKPGYIGMSKGVTRNMENYESFRADAWLCIDRDESKDYQEQFNEISDILDEALEEVISAVIDE